MRPQKNPSASVPVTDAVSSRVSNALRKAASKKFSAFTLVELIVVITILAILATIGFLALSGYSQDAKDATVKANVRSVMTAISAESAITNNSPRYYVVHDTGAALDAGAVAYVDGSPVTLTGGAYGTADTNYSAGNPDWAKLKLNPEKFRLSGSGLPGGTATVLARVAGFGTAEAAYDSSLVSVGAVDAALAPTTTGRARSASFFQVAGVAPATKVVSVAGNFPAPTPAQTASGATAGLVKASTGTGAMVDGGTSGGTSGGNQAPEVTNSCATALPSCNGTSCSLTYAPASVNQAWVNGASSCGFACTGGYTGTDCMTAPAPTFSCGTSTVGTNAYATILWPDGKCWTKENMRHAPSAWNRWCYDNNETNCTNEGALYDWTAANSDLCTQLWAGWALPTNDQWTALTTAGATGWTGNKFSGIVSSLPGNRGTDGSFYGQGADGGWWSSTQYDASLAWYRGLYSGYAAVVADINGKAVGFSVVCLKN